MPIIVNLNWVPYEKVLPWSQHKGIAILETLYMYLGGISFLVASRASKRQAKKNVTFVALASVIIN